MRGETEREGERETVERRQKKKVQLPRLALVVKYLSTPPCNSLSPSYKHRSL